MRITPQSGEANAAHRVDEPSWRALASLKFRLLASGIKLTGRGRRELRRKKPPIRTRSGVSGGVDLVLSRHVHVNCDVTESRVSRSAFSLDWDGRQFCLLHPELDPVAVRVLPRPAFYGRNTTSGVSMVHVGQMCSGDRVCINITRNCCFWRRDRRCKFCSIGTNTGREASQKSMGDVAETVAAAARDAVLPARHALIGGGTPEGDDRGAIYAAEVCRAVKSACDMPVYVMIVPPAKLEYLDLLRDSGVDELAMNVELFDPLWLKEYAPGKYGVIGPKHYYRALEYAVSRFGPANTRSVAVVGLEPPEATLGGVRRLADMGVMPILSPLRALDGSDVADATGFPPALYMELFEEAMAICQPRGLVLGPTCIPCQNNVLAMPLGEPYRYY